MTQNNFVQFICTSTDQEMYTFQETWKFIDLSMSKKREFIFRYLDPFHSKLTAMTICSLSEYQTKTNLLFSRNPQFQYEDNNSIPSWDSWNPLTSNKETNKQIHT
jgi:hypothetical protein